ncbi:hypothetical protein ES703_74753 [subsurface metagenome]
MNQYRQRRWQLAIGLKADFCKLDIPVAILAPEEIVYLSQGFTKLEFIRQAGDARHGTIEPTQNPAVFQWQPVRSDFEGSHSGFNAPDYKSCRVPKLVGEVAAGFQPG